MKIGIIGLGKMGLSVSYRLQAAHHHVIGFDPSPHAQQEAMSQGINVAPSLESITEKTTLIWLMVPAGKPVDDLITSLIPLLPRDAIIIDGGNSHFSDTKRRYDLLKHNNIHLLDCGVSGGIRGQEIGFSLMIGGDKDIYKQIEPTFMALAAPKGYGYFGPSGAGHYVKMVHNGIEYALLQSYAEGCHLLEKSTTYPNLDLHQITDVWLHGSVIRSWIVELLHEIFHNKKIFDTISGAIDENQTGRWTLNESHAQDVPMKLLEDALKIRAESRKTGGHFGTKVVALLRNAFGGHKIEKK